jgi:hypothetical protein
VKTLNAWTATATPFTTAISATRRREEQQTITKKDPRTDQQRKKKIKINCHLLRFLGFAGDGDPHCQQGREEKKKARLPCFLGYLAVAREPTRHQWRRRVEKMRRHECCSSISLPLQFLDLFRGYFVNFKLCIVIFV